MKELMMPSITSCSSVTSFESLQELLFAREDIDHDRVVQAVHGDHIQEHGGGVLRERGVQVAGLADVAARIGEHHRNGGVVADHLEVEAQVAQVPAHQPVRGLGPELHLFAFLLAQAMEQGVGVVDQLGAALHGFRPELHLFAFLLTHLVHDAVAVPQRSPHDRHGDEGQHQLPTLLAGIEVHGVKIGVQLRTWCTMTAQRR
jgi:hypothetical protein